jgi:hypothetical protein
VFGFEPRERGTDHRHGTLDDLLACGNHGARLLAPEHGLCDLGCVRQLVEAGFDYAHARRLHSIVDLVRQFGRDLVGVLPQ